MPYIVYPGMTFEFTRGRLQYIRTARRLQLRQLYRDIRSYRATRHFDVALVDFEPVTARIARRLGIPSIGIGHQYAFSYPVPLAKRDPVARWVLKHFAPVDCSLGLHWHHFGYPILPPVIPPISCDAPVQASKILVYLPFEERAEVLQLLKRFSVHEFYYYTGVEEAADDDNVRLRPFSRSGFIDDLKSCNGVICNAGFELASEALHLGKKLLVKPLAGQLEQTSNALALQLLKLGDAMERLDAAAVESWLSRRAPAPQCYPDVAHLIAEWIGRGARQDTRELVERAWSGVNLPDHLHSLLNDRACNHAPV